MPPLPRCATVVPETSILNVNEQRDDGQGHGHSDDHSDGQDDSQGGVSVPHAELTADALRGVIESFVLREGTDYGCSDVSLRSKIADVMRQLERGEAQVVFDPRTASVNVVLTDPTRR